MRKAVVAVLALSFAAPVVAAPSKAQSDMEAMAAKLQRPETQDAMSGALMAMLGAFMDMRVDGIAKALEPMNGGKPIKMKGRTVREMAERKDPHFEEKIEGGSRAMIGSLGALAGAMAVAMPELERAMEKMEDALPPTR
jgi:hypothetical protein